MLGHSLKLPAIPLVRLQPAADRAPAKPVARPVLKTILYAIVIVVGGLVGLVIGALAALSLGLISFAC